jgi:hypothetical protein
MEGGYGKLYNDYPASSGANIFYASSICHNSEHIVLSMMRGRGGKEVITTKTHMVCPDCKEFVRMGAIKCKHCGCQFEIEGTRPINAA